MVTVACLGVYLALGSDVNTLGCWWDSVCLPLDTSGPLAWASALHAALPGPSPHPPPLSRTCLLQRSLLQGAERLPKQTSPRDL